MAWWLTLPLASLVLISALLVGGLVLRQGRQSTKLLAGQLEQEIGDRTLEQLTAWIEQPKAVNQLNQAALTHQNISLTEPDSITRQFLTQLQAFPELHQLMAADGQGRAISLRRNLLNGGYYLQRTRLQSQPEKSQPGKSDPSTPVVPATLATEILELDTNGKTLKVLTSATGEDLRQTDWYQQALEQQTPIWVKAFEQGEAIAARPVPASATNDATVVATVLDLSKMSQFLQRFTPPTQAEVQVFVLDENGLLLSSSTDEAALLRDIQGQWLNRQAIDSQDPITQATAEYLLPHWDGTFPNQPKPFVFEFNEKTLRGQTQSYQPYEGANWLITVALPEASILGPIRAQQRQMLILVIGLLLLSLLLCRWLVQWITRPLRHLNRAAQELGQGKWQPQLSEGLSQKRRDELGELARSFDWMSGYLQDNFHQLEGQKQRLQKRNQTLLGEKSRLEEQDRLKDEFLAKTSQELRIPLAGILGLAESLQAQALHNDNQSHGNPANGNQANGNQANRQWDSDESSQNASQQRAIELIIFSARRLTTLVNDLLDLSKAQHDHLNLSCTSVELHRVVQHVLALCQPLATPKKLKLINTIPTAFPLAYGDSHRIQQIFYHLISNAIKFTPDGEITVSAAVTPLDAPSQLTSRRIDPQITTHQATQPAQAGQLTITVSDTGIGLTPELQAKLTHAFGPQKTSASHGHSGTGLGLTIVQTLVELHGGRVEARSRSQHPTDSRSSRGSDFHFTLPIFEPAVAQQQPAAPAPKTGNQSAASRPVPKRAQDDAYATASQDISTFQTPVTAIQPPNRATAIAPPSVQSPTPNKSIAAGTTDSPAPDIYSTFVQRTVIQDPIETEEEQVSPAYSSPTVVTAVQPQSLANYSNQPSDNHRSHPSSSNAQQHRLLNKDSLSSKPQARILVIDDDAINIEVLLRQLSLENYQVVSATNGEQALKLLDPNCGHERFDLVILEVMMPRMSGYEICRRLRQDYPSYQLPVIMLTAKVQDEDVVEGFRVGANDYLRKPYSSKELLSRIQTHLTNRLYGRFVPAHFIQFLSKSSIADISLGNQVSCDMTVMFSDIRGFATLSESMSPQENFDFINAYLRCVSPEVRRHQGFIVKYLGDGMMAIFPQSSADAISAGIAQLRQVQQSNPNSSLPPINVGIGIHYGPMMVGIVGEAQRMQGDAFSDDVNLTARLEGLTKFYGVSMLISEQVLEQLGTEHRFHIRYLDQVKVKGRSQPLPIYEVFDADPADSRDRKAETLLHFEAGVHCYQAGEFVAAQGHFRAVTAVNPQDRPARLYCRRVARLIAKPPEETWTGVSAWGRK